MTPIYIELEINLRHLVERGAYKNIEEAKEEIEEVLNELERSKRVFYDEDNEVLWLPRTVVFVLKREDAIIAKILEEEEKELVKWLQRRKKNE